MVEGGEMSWVGEAAGKMPRVEKAAGWKRMTMVKTDESGWKRLKTVEKQYKTEDKKQMEKEANSRKLLKTVKNLLKSCQNGWKRIKWVEDGYKG